MASDAATTDADDGSYCRAHIPTSVMTELEAGAFRSLCSHLRERSDEVQNIDLMTVSGFCRNCLAKWLVVEARRVSDEMQKSGGGGTAYVQGVEKRRRVIQALDALGYDEAAGEVYGCMYPEWKKRHSKKATDEQMQLYSDSKPIHAKHNKSLLEKRVDKPSFSTNAASSSSPGPLIAKSDDSQPKQSLLSDVCCQDVDGVVSTATASKMNALSFQSPPPPKGGVELRIGILTVSDRASAGRYETGDVSGPAVDASIVEYSSINADVTVTSIEREVVPDNQHDIQTRLSSWAGKSGDGDTVCDLIFTTGGTGFAPRDVTPEATSTIVDRECPGLMSWASAECSTEQPLAPLSRGTAGICGKTLIVNLPGNPAGASQVVRLLFPLLLHAVKDLQVA